MPYYQMAEIIFKFYLLSLCKFKYPFVFASTFVWNERFSADFFQSFLTFWAHTIFNIAETFRLHRMIKVMLLLSGNTFRQRLWLRWWKETWTFFFMFFKYFVFFRSIFYFITFPVRIKFFFLFYLLLFTFFLNYLTTLIVIIQLFIMQFFFWASWQMSS